MIIAMGGQEGSQVIAPEPLEEVGVMEQTEMAVLLAEEVEVQEAM
jgi:hypothetical protein